jgi:hypothetical protein
MMEFEKRAYIRANCICEAEIVIDEEDDETEEISVLDLAAGGLSFIADKNNSEYKFGETYRLKLCVNEHNADIDIATNIKIKRVSVADDGAMMYGASFENPFADQSIRIDEFILYKKRMRNQG